LKCKLFQAVENIMLAVKKEAVESWKIKKK
jgi:hypothetical protein